MVDYSKWDRMDFGSSSSESDSDDGGGGGGGGAGGPPRVTSLDRPGRVTVRPDGRIDVAASSSPSPSRTQSPAEAASSSEKRRRAGGIPSVSGGESGDVVDISPGGGPSNGSRGEAGERRRSTLTRDGGSHAVPIVVDGTERKLPLCWSQDRHTVVLSLGFPPQIFPTRGIRVRVEGALSYEERERAVGGGGGATSGGIAGGNAGEEAGGEGGKEASFGSVEVVSVSNEAKEETALLKGNLPRPIHLDRDEEEVDWEIEDRLGEDDDDDDDERKCTKLVTIAMSKAAPMAGMALWWDRPLTGHPTIDVSTIRGRRGANETGNDETKEAFRNAWEEAHATFRERVEAREKTTVEVDD
ncbi:hypothetical protein ACHAWF_002066 [Thalassiosira exigua]